MEFISDPRVKEVFDSYPEAVRRQMSRLRQLVIDTAAEIDGLHKLEETLKWGEPSYLTRHGSTLRIDWKSRSPNQYAMCFQCSSRLVETFKFLFKNTFSYEGKRALIFNMDEEIPEDKLKYCIRAALTYHNVKHLPTLGI